MANTGRAGGTGLEIAYAGDTGRAAATGLQVAYAGGKGRVASFGLMIAYAEYKPKLGSFGVEVAYAGTKGRAGAQGLMVAYSEEYRYYNIDDTVPDDGGYPLTLQAILIDGHSYTIAFVNDDLGISEIVYSGVIGQGTELIAVDGSLSFVSPPVPVGVYDIEIVDLADGPLGTIPDAIEVVRRSFVTTLYTMREWHPPPRDVGAYSVLDEATIASEVDLWEGVVTAIADTLYEVGTGRLLTRTTATYSGGGTLLVEGTDRFPTEGRIAFNGIQATYTGVTATSFTGLLDLQGDAIAATAPAGSVVMDDGLQANQFDDLRASFLRRYALDEELDTIGRNAGLTRIPGLDDDTYREFLGLVMYGPVGGTYIMELVLEVLRPGDWELYEILPRDHHTVYVDLDQELATDTTGRTYLVGGEEQASTSTTTVDVTIAPTLVYGIWLATDPERSGTNYANLDIAGNVSGSSFFSAGLFMPDDDGKFVIFASDRSHWRVSYSGPAVLELVGDEYDDGRTSASFPTRFGSDHDRFAAWMVGHSIEVLTGVDAGVYTIASIVDPRTVVLTGATFGTDLDVQWKLVADYAAAADTIEINRVSVSGLTVTFPTPLGGSPTDLLVDYTTVPSAIVLYGTSADGTGLSPFYLYDDTYITQTALDLVRDAGFQVVVRNT